MYTLPCSPAHPEHRYGNDNTADHREIKTFFGWDFAFRAGLFGTDDAFAVEEAVDQYDCNGSAET